MKIVKHIINLLLLYAYYTSAPGEISHKMKDTFQENGRIEIKMKFNYQEEILLNQKLFKKGPWIVQYKRQRTEGGRMKYSKVERKIRNVEDLYDLYKEIRNDSLPFANYIYTRLPNLETKVFLAVKGNEELLILSANPIDSEAYNPRELNIGYESTSVRIALQVEELNYGHSDKMRS